MTKLKLTQTFIDNATRSHLIELIELYQNTRNTFFRFKFDTDGFVNEQDLEVIELAKKVLDKTINKMEKERNKL